MRHFFTTVLVLIAFSISAQKKTKEQSLPVFTVAGKPVNADEFIYLYKKNHQNKPEEFTEQSVEEYLNLFINFKLKVTEAQARGIDTTEAFVKEFNSYKEELRKPYLPDSKILDSLVRLTYERMKEEVNASHILIGIKPDASPEDTAQVYKKIIDIRDKWSKGEEFEALAEQFSEDPSAKFNKGNLGYFTALQMVYPFEQAAFTTQPGSVSMPVRTRFGYHLIKVNDKRPSKGEVEVSHIMIRTGEDKDNEKSKNTIFEIYDQLQQGVKWDELVQQYSEDPGSKQNGGKLRPFGVGVMASVPEFEKVAFELQSAGDISDPFQTQYGWHIVKLERKIPMASFEEMAATLKNRVGRDERVQVSKQALYEKIRRENNFKEHASQKEKLFALADSTLTEGIWKPAFADASKSTLIELGGKQFSVQEFIDFVNANRKRTQQQPKEYVAQLYNTFVESKLVSLLEEKILQNSPDFRWLLKEYYEGILLFDIMEKEVWNKASEDSIGQRKFFDSNPGKYKAEERAQGEIYASTTKAHIEELKKALEQNDSTLVASLVDSLNIKVEDGKFEKNERVVLSKIDWAPGLYQTENNNTAYLVEVEKIIPPGPKTFEEARPEVISDYQTYLENTWIEQLKKKYPVKINKKGKSFVMKNLTSQQNQ